MCSAWLWIHSPQYSNRRSATSSGSTRHAACVFDRVAGTHLIGDRADAAHPRGDVRRLGIGPATQECLEEPRRLIDVQLDAVHRTIGQRDMQRALTFDAGQRADRQCADLGIHLSFRSAVKLATLNVENTRSTSPPDMPSRRSSGISAAVLGVAAGPKQP